jgi:hypothetical protein
VPQPAVPVRLPAPAVVEPDETGRVRPVGSLVGQTVYCELQVERTAGTGNVGATPIRLLNRESP